MTSFMTMNSIHSHTTPNQKNTKSLINGIYVSYAIVIGIHRIILFDPFNNVQGFIFNGSVLSVHEAGPELSACILEPLLVADSSVTQPVSPTSSVISGTTVSSNTDDHPYNEMETNESSPDPPPSLLLSAPEYIPRSKCIANNDSESASAVTAFDVASSHASASEEKNDSRQEAEHKQHKTEEEEKMSNNNIVSIVGNRVVLIPSMETIKTHLSPISNDIHYSYNLRRKKCIRNSGLKRSRTTFEPKRRRVIVDRRRSKSCGILTVVREECK